MGLKAIRPITPGQRGAVRPDFKEITKREPERSLLETQNKTGGRNNLGRATARHRGGGSRQHYRLVDFQRDKHGVPGRVVGVEYDPNRTARIALVLYADGERRYILAPIDLKPGDTVMAGPEAEPRSGNALPLRNIPGGTLVHNLELQPGKGGQIVRSAGTSAQVLSRDGDMVMVRLPSGEIRRVLEVCYATVGVLSNPDHKNITWGKAGKSRHRGRRPHVRGTAQSPRDHPHGGGEGKTGEGLATPKTPWGKPARGVRTRPPKKPSNALIMQRRKRK